MVGAEAREQGDVSATRKHGGEKQGRKDTYALPTIGHELICAAGSVKDSRVSRRLVGGI